VKVVEVHARHILFPEPLTMALILLVHAPISSHKESIRAERSEQLFRPAEDSPQLEASIAHAATVAEELEAHHEAHHYGPGVSVPVDAVPDSAEESSYPTHIGDD